jgi:hypothetical protein
MSAMAADDANNDEGIPPTESGDAGAENTEVPMISNLVILPPRQVTSSSTVIRLPPLPTTESLSNMRAILSEIVGFAHISCFHWEIVHPDVAAAAVAAAAASSSNIPVVSPYTGRQAVIVAPLSACCQAPITTAITTASVSYPYPVTDEYLDWFPLVEAGILQNGCGLEMVLERYTISSVRQQVRLTQALCRGGSQATLEGDIPAAAAVVIPTVTDYHGLGANRVEKPVAVSDDEEAIPPATAAASAATTTVTAAKKKKKKSSKNQTSAKKNGDAALAPDSSLPLLKRTDLVVARQDYLANFFYHVCGEQVEHYTAGAHHIRQQLQRLNALETDVQMLECSISYSPGFHPPPRHRRLVGDLAYLEVVIASKTTLYITATLTGFYVNKTTDRQSFDPSPRPEKNAYAHTLLDCLLQASPDVLAPAWERVLSAARERATLYQQLSISMHDSDEEEHHSGLEGGELWTTLFHLAIRGDAGGFRDAMTAFHTIPSSLDTSLQIPMWLVPSVDHAATAAAAADSVETASIWNRHASHPYDVHRGESLPDRVASLRDWNEEVQMARELPTGTAEERLERARLMHKVLTEYGEVR